jgi:hypothetical protein
MVKTLVGYSGDPSRKAMAVAGVIVTVGGAYLVKKNKDPIVKAAASVALPLLARPLAVWLTQMGIV